MSSTIAGPPPKLVVTDLDGTLLDASGTRISERNLAALRRAQDAGSRVIIATGRPIWWLGPVLNAGLRDIAVCMNGAVVYDIGSDDIVSASPMTPAVMRSFVAALERQWDDFALAVERLGTSISECWAEAGYSHPWVSEFRVADRRQLLDKPAAKLLVRSDGDSDTFAKAARETGIDDVAVTFSSGDGLLEVAASGVSKGSTVARLAESWGLTAADTIAFGDMPNDLELLAWSGRGVAMQNAHPDLLAVADQVTAHHDEDGVALVLEQWF